MSRTFALMIETACGDYEALEDILSGAITMTFNRNEARFHRHSGAIRMALAKSFLFHLVRAHRILEREGATVPISREDRRDALRKLQPVVAVRNVNEHGFEANASSKPSLHQQMAGDIALDETSLVITSVDQIFMGSLNLHELRAPAMKLRSLAGFAALALGPNVPC